MNTVTLRVSDLAGNVTTTNLEVVLDFTLATNAPVLVLVWPTNDMQISGDSFYIRGKINDETATLVAQQVDVNDVTNTVTGIVERNGMFWVENLPLTAENNEWTIIATDAAGNVSSTNLTVAKSTVTVTITSTPTGDALYDPSGTVSGTVSDASYAVSVNGVAATVDGSGNWTAENVPNYGQGTVTYDAMASPPSGGGSSPVQASVQTELAPIVKVTKHLMALVKESWFGSYNYTKTYTASYAPGTSGDWQPKYSGQASEYSVDDTEGVHGVFSSVATWSDTDPVGTVSGETTPWGSFGPEPLGETEDKVNPHQSFGHIVGGIPVYLTHYYAKGVRHNWPQGDGKEYMIFATSRTTETLYTGGKSGVDKKNLFSLTAGTTEYHGKPPQFEWIYAPTREVLNEEVTVGGSPLGWDGRVYAVLPDNTPVDVTVRVKGAKHYKAGAAASKHALVHLTECTALTNPDNARTTVGVGEYVNFAFVPPVSMSSPETPQWEASAGSVNPTTGEGTKFTAPSSGGAATVTVYVRDVEMKTEFGVKEPSGVYATKNGTNPPHEFVAGELGVCMWIRMIHTPTDVSFYRVETMELPGPASNITGYFIDHQPKDHDPGEVWVPIGCDNADLAQDHCHMTGVGRPPPWSEGGFDWVVPVQWRVGSDGIPKSHPGWTQSFRIISADGTATISKAGATATRTP